MAEALAIGSIITTAAATGYSMYASNRQAKAEESMANYNARQADITAQNMADEAYEASRRAEVEKRRALASVNTDVAASGAVMEGSPLAVLGEISKRYEVDRLDTLRRGMTQAQQTRTQGQIARYQGQASAAGLRMGSIGTLMGGVSSMASIGSRYYYYKEENKPKE